MCSFISTGTSIHFFSCISCSARWERQTESFQYTPQSRFLARKLRSVVSKHNWKHLDDGLVTFATNLQLRIITPQKPDRKNEIKRKIKSLKGNVFISWSEGWLSCLWMFVIPCTEVKRSQPGLDSMYKAAMLIITAAYWCTEMASQ